MAIGNLIEQEDMAKGLPDDVLLQEAQQPSGQLPQFLLISEVQRRTDMRKRYQLQMQEMEPTVAEQIMQEGIAGVAQPPPEIQQAMNGSPPPMQPPMNVSPQPMAVPPPMAGPPQQPPTQMAYQGGVVGMQGGRKVPAQIPDSLLNKVPSSIVEDAMKYSPDRKDQDDDAEGAVLKTKDMGVPSVIDKKGGKSNIVRNLLGMASGPRDRVRFESTIQDAGGHYGNELNALPGLLEHLAKPPVGGSGGSSGAGISGRLSTALPIGKNRLELGASGSAHWAPGSRSARLSELDAIFNMLDKNRSIQGYFQPGGGGFGFNLQQRFNQGGVIGMQNGSTVPDIDPNAEVAPQINSITPYDPMASYQAQQQQRYDDLKKYIGDITAQDKDRVRREEMSQALINIGAGIAGGDLSAGLTQAGTAIASGREKQREREQMFQLELMKGMPGAGGASGSRVQSTQTLENGNIALVMSDGTIVDTGQKKLRTSGLKIQMIAGVPHIVDAVTNQLVPLSTQAGEIGFETAKSSAEFEEDQRQERITQAPIVANALSDAVKTTGVVDEAVDNALEFLENNTTAGVIGGSLSWVPGTDMLALGITLDTLKANLGFDRLQAMREASPTGGALGQVSEKELALLVRAAGAIDQKLPPDILRERLGYLLEEYKGFRDSSISDFIAHADAVENESVQKRYKSEINLYRRKANNPKASPGSRRAAQAVVDQWDRFQRRYGGGDNELESMKHAFEQAGE